MKTTKEKKASLGAITENEQIKVKDLITLLSSIKDRSELTEETLKDIYNIYSEISLIKESWTNRYIRLLKQGNDLS